MNSLNKRDEEIQERAAKRAESKRNAKKVEEKKKQLKEMFNIVFATEEGIMVLRTISEMAGHNQSSITIDPTSGEINTESTIYNEARRNLYLQIRDMVRPSILKKVEFK